MAKPHGLRNNGNTCYFNATLQNLYRTVVFRKNLEYMSTLWKQQNPAHVVNESTSSGNNSFVVIVGKLLHNILKGDLKKYFVLFLTSLAVYKVGSRGVLISTARWILEQPQFIRSVVQKLLSSASVASFHVDHGTNCSAITFQEYLNLFRVFPRTDHLVAIHCEFNWFPALALALLVGFFCYNKNFLRNFFREALRRFSRCGWKLRGWLSRSDVVVLCYSGLLSYCAGHLMASTQPIYKCLVERNPGTIGALLVMALSTSLLSHQLGVIEVLLDLFQGFRWQPDQPITPVSVALARLFRNIDSESGNSCHDPRAVLEAVCGRSKRFCGYRQQDSHELLRHLLDGIREEERDLKKEANCLTLVDRVFGGHLRTVYTCQTCKSPYCLYEAFLDISIPITLHEDTLKELSDTENDERNNQRSVEFWLKVFSRSENLGEQYLCSVCNVSSTGDNYHLTVGTKQTLICDPPAILCIHVKRFRKTADDFIKANDHVEFSEYLDLKPFLTNDCRRLGENKMVMYALFGVVVHCGSLEGGHYTAYIRSQSGDGKDITGSSSEEFLQSEGFDWDSLPTGGFERLENEPINIPRNSPNLSQRDEWYYCSDSTVNHVGAEEVFKQAAYLLFYERLC